MASQGWPASRSPWATNQRAHQDQYMRAQKEFQELRIKNLVTSQAMEDWWVSSVTTTPPGKGLQLQPLADRKMRVLEKVRDGLEIILRNVDLEDLYDLERKIEAAAKSGGSQAVAGIVMDMAYEGIKSANTSAAHRATLRNVFELRETPSP